MRDMLYGYLVYGMKTIVKLAILGMEHTPFRGVDLKNTTLYNIENEVLSINFFKKIGVFI